MGNFICKPPRFFGKVKRAVDVFNDICQASLLHLTKAAVSFLNFSSGQIITGPEKARRGPRVQSISLRPFSIERSLFLRRKQAISVSPSITYLLWAVLSSHMLLQELKSHLLSEKWDEVLENEFIELKSREQAFMATRPKLIQAGYTTLDSIHRLKKGSGTRFYCPALKGVDNATQVRVSKWIQLLHKHPNHLHSQHLGGKSEIAH